MRLRLPYALPALALTTLLAAGPLAAEEKSEGAGAPAGREEELIRRVRTLADQLQGDAAPAGQPAPRAPALAEREIATRIAERLGVEVLEVRSVELDGAPAYAVKVMNPGGNSNAAFRVSTLLVDGDSGTVLGQVRPERLGEGAAPPAAAAGLEAEAPEIRRRTYR